MSGKMSEAAELLKWLSILDVHVKTQLDKQLAAWEINSSQYFYILKIYNQPGMSREALFEHAYKNPSNISRGLEQLEEKGYVIKEVSPTDKRTYLWYPTLKAHEVAPLIENVLQEVVDKTFSEFTPKQREVFLQMLRIAGEKAYTENLLNK